MIELWKGLTIDRKDFKSVEVNIFTSTTQVRVQNQQGDFYTKTLDSSANATRIYNKIKEAIHQYDRNIIEYKAYCKAQN